jgi:hypothetical protein
MVKYVLKRVSIAGRIAFEAPRDTRANENIKHELRKCRDKYGDFVLVTMQPPKKPRTTGKDSQNHHLNGHIMQICNETGNDYESVKTAVKLLAVESMGYPYRTIAGQIVPQRESDSSTDECAKLIEAAHVLAADLGIILQE